MKKGMMSRIDYPVLVKRQIRRTLPLIRSNVLAQAGTSRRRLVSESGLTDNQLQYALRMAYGGKAPKPLYRGQAGDKLYDSADLLECFARWTGSWAYRRCVDEC